MFIDYSNVVTESSSEVYIRLCRIVVYVNWNLDILGINIKKHEKIKLK